MKSTKNETPFLTQQSVLQFLPSDLVVKCFRNTLMFLPFLQFPGFIILWRHFRLLALHSTTLRDCPVQVINYKASYRKALLNVTLPTPFSLTHSRVWMRFCFPKSQHLLRHESCWRIAVLSVFVSSFCDFYKRD